MIVFRMSVANSYRLSSFFYIIFSHYVNIILQEYFLNVKIQLGQNEILFYIFATIFTIF